MVGHIKIDRKILNWEWYNDYKMVHLFLHLLIKANWVDGSWRGSIIKRGQYMTSVAKLSANTGLSVSQIRTGLSKLQMTGEITSEMTSLNTLITVCKYDTYQSEKKQDSKPISNQIDNQDSKPDSKRDSNNIRKQEDKNINPIGEPEILDSIFEGTLVQRMVAVFKSHNPNYVIDPEVHYPPCLQIAYRIAKMKKWEDKEVLNGKMDAAIKSWEKIVLFVKNDEWLSTRSLIDLNSNKEWDRLFLKMQKDNNSSSSKEKAGNPIKKEKEVDFDKYKKR